MPVVGTTIATLDTVVDTTAGLTGSANGLVETVLDSANLGSLTSPIDSALNPVTTELVATTSGLTGGVLDPVLNATTDLLASTNSGTNTLLDPVIGVDGVLPATSTPGNQTALDPLVGPHGVLPLTSGNTDSGTGLLSPLNKLL